MSRYAKGCTLSAIPKATDVPAVDLTKILAIDSSNPFIRALRIQQGFLKAETLPPDLRTIVPRQPTEEK
jgi:hypothetical protein